MFYAVDRTRVTMITPSTACSVEEAERQFTDEPDSLISRRSDAHIVINTGACSCQESHSQLAQE